MLPRDYALFNCGLSLAELFTTLKVVETLSGNKIRNVWTLKHVEVIGRSCAMATAKR